MVKKIVLLLLVASLVVFTTGCEDQADIASYNISKEADNFNIVRQLTVINCITDTVLFQMQGRISIEVDDYDEQLEIIVEENDGSYCKHSIGLADNVTYVVEDLNLGQNEVDQFNYSLNFNPEMILPYEVTTID